MATLTINVRNNDRVGEFYVYPERAVVNANSQPVYVLYSAYKKTKAVTSSSETALICPKEYYAVCGTHQTLDIKSGATVSTKDSRPVQAFWALNHLGSRVTVTNDGSGSVKFDDAGSRTDYKDQLNCFQIQTKDLVGPRHFIGLGARDPSNGNQIIPISVIPAQPNTTYTFEPQSTYFLLPFGIWPGHLTGAIDSAAARPISFDPERSSSVNVAYNSGGIWGTF